MTWRWLALFALVAGSVTFVLTGAWLLPIVAAIGMPFMYWPVEQIDTSPRLVDARTHGDFLINEYLNDYFMPAVEFLIRTDEVSPEEWFEPQHISNMRLAAELDRVMDEARNSARMNILPSGVEFYGVDTAPKHFARPVGRTLYTNLNTGMDFYVEDMLGGGYNRVYENGERVAYADWFDVMRDSQTSPPPKNSITETACEISGGHYHMLSNHGCLQCGKLYARGK